MNKVNFYIDGFNMYHTIINADKKLRWINYKKLCERFITKNTDQVNKIYYFSAIHPSATKQAKHEDFISALDNEGVIIKLGKFKGKDIFYKERLNLSEQNKKISLKSVKKIIQILKFQIKVTK